MELISNKFKFLQPARKLLGDAIVPVFQKIERDILTIKFDKLKVLRSSLKSEAQKVSLQSGKSISILNLSNLIEFKAALKRVYNQEDLLEVILQDQVLWEQHLTLIYEEDFIFIEIKDRNSDQIQFYYTSLAGESGHFSFVDKLKKYLKKLAPILKEDKLWIMEWGVVNSELSLFQIHPISSDYAEHIFSDDLALQLLQSKNRFQGQPSFKDLILTEWSAFLYRKKKQKNFEIKNQDVFINWEYIFHYYRLYCQSRNLKPTNVIFNDFLNQTYKNNYFSNTVKVHLSLANKFRNNETYAPIDYILEGKSKLNFLGKGQFSGTINGGIVLLAELTPEAVYQLPESCIILTKTVSLLGHGILASVERGLPVLSGISEEEWEKLLKCNKIFLDFENQIFKIE
jgi:hypothetical protein